MVLCARYWCYFLWRAARTRRRRGPDGDGLLSLRIGYGAAGASLTPFSYVEASSYARWRSLLCLLSRERPSRLFSSVSMARWLELHLRWEYAAAARERCKVGSPTRCIDHNNAFGRRI